MISFNLTGEQQLLQKTARNFAEKEIAPVVEKINSMDRTKGTPWTFSREVFQKAQDLGLLSLLIPMEYGGGGLGCMENVLVQEELGAVDMGIAASLFNMTIAAPMIIMKAGTEKQRQKWLPEICKAAGPLASCGSEPNMAGSEFMCPYPDPGLGVKTSARREGNDYIINGAKSGFITNAGVASNYYVIARNDLRRWSVFLNHLILLILSSVKAR